MIKKVGNSVYEFFLQPRATLIIYILLALIASLQLLLLPPHMFSGRAYTEYNNYVIFRQSFHHLMEAKNLYTLYPDEQWDLYKYSPAFSLFMGLLAYLPDFVGVTIWTLINTIALFFAVRTLPFSNRKQNMLLLFVMIELLTSLQNTQSNGLMAGLFIGAYSSMQKGKMQWATLWLVIATFIKIYGAVGFCLFLFYPDKLRVFAYAILWSFIFFFIPILVTPFNTLIWQYHNWVSMMAEDQSVSYGLSVMGWLHSWFGIDKGKSVVSVLGLILFFIPFARISLYKNQAYRLLMLASMLLWVIIFNHKAESPTFIIAVAGVGIWYFSGEPLLWRRLLLLMVFLFTIMSPTDLFPPIIRENIFKPFTIKAIPCIIVWCVVFVELIGMKNEPSQLIETQ